jgi:hypothetical protein
MPSSNLNVQTKKSNFLSRVIAAGIAAADAIEQAKITADEYNTNAFNGGDQANRPEYTITDADLVELNFPWLAASNLNQFIGGLNALHDAYQANAGVIEAARP